MAKKKKKKNEQGGAIALVAVALILVCGLIAVIAHSKVGKRELPTFEDKENQSTAESTVFSETESQESTEEVAEEEAEKTEVKDIPEKYRTYFTREQMHAGDLILVNSEYEYSFEQTPEDIRPIKDIREHKFPMEDDEMEMSQHAFVHMDWMIADCDEALQDGKDTGLSSSYRTAEYQQELWDYYKRLYGEEYCESYVATPGFSEHHTGLAADITVYQNGIEQSFSNDEARKEWMEEHCAEYGFVRRYKEDKVDITKVSNEAWHFRYVGRPHATYMNEHNLCLEEYIDELKKHTVDDPIEIEAGGTYRIYYSELDYIRTPENDFEVSGNNVDGYIITEKLGA